MKNIKFAKKMMMGLILFFIIYNTVFGWNKLPITQNEETCDYIFKIGMYFAWTIYFLPVFNLYEKLILSKTKADE